MVVGGFVFHPNLETGPALPGAESHVGSTHTPPSLGPSLSFQVFMVSSGQLKIPAAIITYFQLSSSAFVCQTLSCYRSKKKKKVEMTTFILITVVYDASFSCNTD